MQINATQAAGVAGFGMAALLALAASRAVRRDAGAWRLIAFFQLLAAAEVVMMTRHRVSRFAGMVLVEVDDYVGRRAPQALLILLLAAIGLYLAVTIAGRMRRRGGAVRAAAVLTVAALTLFAVETVSLHQVDGLLYGPVGPVRLIGWLWLALGATTGLLALAATGRRG